MLSSGLQHNCFLANDCPRFRIFQYYLMPLWINFLKPGWCFLSKISQIALPSGFNAPWFNTTVPGGILGNRNGVIRPRHALRLHSSKRGSCCDDATKSKLGFRHTLKEELPKSNQACCGVKKFNPIILSADVGNLQTKNERLKVTLPI